MSRPICNQNVASGQGNGGSGTSKDVAQAKLHVIRSWMHGLRSLKDLQAAEENNLFQVSVGFGYVIPGSEN
jgi:hypothetical protein